MKLLKYQVRGCACIPVHMSAHTHTHHTFNASVMPINIDISRERRAPLTFSISVPLKSPALKPNVTYAIRMTSHTAQLISHPECLNTSTSHLKVSQSLVKENSRNTSAGGGSPTCVSSGRRSQSKLGKALQRSPRGGT